MMMAELIAFYSRAGENHVDGETKYLETGNTKIAAGIIQKITGADMVEIVPEKAYSPVYKECVAEAVKDWKNNARPAIAGCPETIEKYDTIYLGYPNYCGTMPMCVFTFLEKYDLTGKTIRPFCTNEGNGMGQSEEDIRKICPGAYVGSGLSIKGSTAADAGPDIKEWLQEK